MISKAVYLSAVCLLIGTASALKAQTHNIKNDIFWNTRDGQPIYSQGGGIFKFADPATGKNKYYWYGVHYMAADKYRAEPFITQSSSAFQSVTCYSSTDLVNWAPEGDVLTKENANTEAFADVKVNGEVLIEQAPVSFLLQFERMLTQEVRGLIVSLPTLDPAYEWTPSDASEAGVYETEVTKRGRTKKVQKPIVLYPATDKHAAQTQLITEDELVGYWSEKKFSGAISAARKQELLDRVDTLIAAVKFAREEANSRDVEMKAAGAQIFAHLFA